MKLLRAHGVSINCAHDVISGHNFMQSTSQSVEKCGQRGNEGRGDGSGVTHFLSIKLVVEMVTLFLCIIIFNTIEGMANIYSQITY